MRRIMLSPGCVKVFMAVNKVYGLRNPVFKPYQAFKKEFSVMPFRHETQ